MVEIAVWAVPILALVLGAFTLGMNWGDRRRRWELDLPLTGKPLLAYIRLHNPRQRPTVHVDAVEILSPKAGGLLKHGTNRKPRRRVHVHRTAFPGASLEVPLEVVDFESGGHWDEAGWLRLRVKFRLRSWSSRERARQVVKRIPAVADR